MTKKATLSYRASSATRWIQIDSKSEDDDTHQDEKLNVYYDARFPSKIGTYWGQREGVSIRFVVAREQTSMVVGRG